MSQLSFPTTPRPAHGDVHRTVDYYRNPAPSAAMRAAIVARLVRAIRERSGDRLAIELAGERCRDLGGNVYEGERYARWELCRPRVDLRRAVTCRRCGDPFPDGSTGGLCSSCVFDKYL